MLKQCGAALEVCRARVIDSDVLPQRHLGALTGSVGVEEVEVYESLHAVSERERAP